MKNFYRLDLTTSPVEKVRTAGVDKHWGGAGTPTAALRWFRYQLHARDLRSSTGGPADRQWDATVAFHRGHGERPALRLCSGLIEDLLRAQATEVADLHGSDVIADENLSAGTGALGLTR
jgi:hypothetical protein